MVCDRPKETQTVSLGLGTMTSALNRFTSPGRNVTNTSRNKLLSIGQKERPHKRTQETPERVAGRSEPALGPGYHEERG